MREKSQIEDMRAAVRGDMERARARREADPWRAPEPAEQAEPEPEPPLAEVVPNPDPEPEPEPESQPLAETAEPPQEPEPVVETMEGPSEPRSSEPPSATEPAMPAKKSFFARLFGRG